MLVFMTLSYLNQPIGTRNQTLKINAHHKCAFYSSNGVYELGVVGFSYEIEILFNENRDLKFPNFFLLFLQIIIQKGASLTSSYDFVTSLNR